MKIKEIGIKNFRGYGENSNDPEGFYRFKNLDSNLVLLNGYNGFGKTSFFDAIEWCLTDKLNRIQDLQKVIKLDNLKKSNYLKFHNKTEKDNKRRVEVFICFDDGSSIRRVSEFNSIDENGYKSKVLLSDENLNILKKKLLNDSNDEFTDIFRINFLSQENINGILRAKSPPQRADEFLKVLGLSSIKKIVEKSKINKLPTVRNQIKNKLKDINKNKQKLESIFQSNGWEDFDEYENKVKNIIIQSINFQERCVYLKNIIEIDKKEFEEYNIDDLPILVDKCVLKLDKLSSEYKEYNKLLNTLIEQFLIKKIINQDRNIKDIKFLKETDINKLIKTDYKAKIDYYTNNNKILIQEISKCDIYKDIWIQFDNKRENGNISSILLYEFIDKCKKSFEFIEVFQRYLNDKYKLKKFKKMINLKWWFKVLEINEEYINNINKLINIIESKENEIKKMSKVNTQYVNILCDIKKYIDDKNLNYCPVCFNDNFSKYDKNVNSKELTNKDKLINIIDSTIKGSNKDIEMLQKQLKTNKDKLKRLQQMYKERLIDKVVENYRQIKELHDIFFEEIIKNLQKMVNCHGKNIRFFEKYEQQVKEDIYKYRSIYKQIFNKDLDFFSEVEIQDIDIKNMEDILIRMKKNYSKKYNIYDFNIDNLRNELEAREKYLNDLNKETDMKSIKKKINELNKIMKILDKIKLYKFSSESKKLFDEYLKYSSREDVLKNKLEQLMEYETNISIINKNSKMYQDEMIKKRLSNNRLVQYIYQKINPHPFFRKIKMDYSNARGGSNWINIIDDDDKNIFLDHIFSSAQLNILALSIFLGLSLNQNVTKLNQFFLDDPIQSMDDINILTFIDLLRAIVGARCIGSNIIISTHDNNFAKLLSIKMRNSNLKIFEFIGYGDEGPEIKYV